jgi:hypothetical protein
LRKLGRFCDKNLTNMGGVCQNVDLNRGAFTAKQIWDILGFRLFEVLGERFNGLSNVLAEGGDQTAVCCDK